MSFANSDSALSPPFGLAEINCERSIHICIYGLCIDTRLPRLNRYVALKIGVSKSTEVCQELKILQALDQNANHPGRNHVQQLLDHFHHEGPNGTHTCLVFEPMGRNLNSYIFDYERSQWKSGSEACEHLPLRFSRQLCKQLVLALDYLHSQGIMHRDIQPGNILCTLDYELDALSEDEIQSDTNTNVIPIETVDRHHRSEGDPNYLLESKPVNDNIPFTAPPPDFRIVLSDLGAACTFAESGSGLETYPEMLRAPEVVLKLPFSEKADIWNLGCTIFEIVFSARPFSAYSAFGTSEDREDDILESFVESLGPMPQHLWLKVPRPLGAVDASGRLRKHTPEELKMGCGYYSLREIMELHRLKDMSDAELDAFESFIRSTLQYEPEKRASTQDLLQHSWIIDF
ncbi:Serine/threonine/dual specificity protein kinase, catalytic domain [Lasallia pustulata]|uniref:non-specific serine/threonine protein kinase n=1 Tax=Lasallia pustulata TaxID=136370 RepID=A0A1W5DEW5_9LECA|nr:Serine/threonine/dual specificity protein kinase, catalytic domain [Lasallia pustulata]